MKLLNNDLKRFSKQIILKKIGVIGQKRLFSSKVLVIGAGGLGCPLILYLANSGIGKIGIADDDKIELSNLNRQVLFTTKDIGKLKVIQVQPIRGAFPRNINLTPNANWLLAAGADSNTVAAHRVDPKTGKLTYQRGSVINVPSPICILFLD